MSTNLSVVVLTTKLPEDIWMINRIADVCRIEGIIFPTGRRYREYGLAHVLKKRLRRIGPFALVNQAMLLLYRLVFESRRDRRAVNEIFTGKPNDHIEPKGIDIIKVDNINSDAVRDFISAKAPELVVVSGAPLLKKHIIEAAGRRIINMHPGFAPQYRGRYGSFWPIYNKEPELVGVTIHFVDEGTDTGAILLQQQIDYYADDTLKIITYKQHKLGVDLLVKCLKDFDTIAPKAYHKTGCPDKNYLAPGLTHYLKGRLWLSRRKRTGNLISATPASISSPDSRR